MSESVLTAAYRKDSISAAEKQEIINAAVAEIDSSKPRYKQVSVNFTRSISLGKGSSKTEYADFAHGMKSIQTAKLIVTNRVYITGSSASEVVPNELASGYEVPITSTALTLMKGSWYGHSTTLNIFYNSTNIRVAFICSTPSGGSNTAGFYGTGVIQLYGTY